MPPNQNIHCCTWPWLASSWYKLSCDSWPAPILSPMVRSTYLPTNASHALAAHDCMRGRNGMFFVVWGAGDCTYYLARCIDATGVLISFHSICAGCPPGQCCDGSDPARCPCDANNRANSCASDCCSSVANGCSAIGAVGCGAFVRSCPPHCTYPPHLSLSKICVIHSCMCTALGILMSSREMEVCCLKECRTLAQECELLP